MSRMRAETKWRTLTYFWILVGLVAVILIDCNAKKNRNALAEAAWTKDEPGVPESSGLAWVGKYCETVRVCALEDAKGADPDIIAVLEKRLKKESCVEMFQESKLYGLEFPDPKSTFERTVSCLKAVSQSDCSTIRKGVVHVSEDCRWMFDMQNSDRK